MTRRPLTLGFVILASVLSPGLLSAATFGTNGISTAKTTVLNGVAKQHSSAILLVGHPDRGTGTAFVISKKHRLVATAAHVADLSRGPNTMFGVVNGTNHAYNVSRIWYHPGLRRRIDDGLTVRSADPIDGPVDVPGPDVAVLQLGPGAPLPDEFTLAGPDLLEGITTLPIALVGYPGYGRWPSRDEPAIATVHTGRVQIEDSFSFDEGPHPSRRQVIEHSAATPEGSSGSPVFTTEGEVVGVHNILKLQRGGGHHEAGMSVRIDALWELLVYHRLDHLIPAKSVPWDVIVTAEPMIDPQRDNIRKAVRLVDESEVLLARNDFRNATRLCSEALQLAPGYPRAYLQRSRSYTGYCGTHWSKLSGETRRQQTDWAIADAKMSLNLAPDRVDSLCVLLQNVLYLGLLDQDKEIFREAIHGADSLLRSHDLNREQQSYLTNCRAQAKQYLGDWDGSLRDYTEAIRLSPRDPFWYQNRAMYWEQRGRPDLAEADRQAALGLIPR